MSSIEPVTDSLDAALTTLVNHRTKTTSVVHTVESARDVVIDESELKPLSDQLKIIIEARGGGSGRLTERDFKLFQEVCHIANIKYKSTKTQKKKKKTDVQKEETKRKRAIFDESIERNKENDFDESSQGWKRVRGNYGEILFNNRLMISDSKHYEDYFFTFEEAVARADEIDCCSITKTGWGYSLRGDMIPVKIGISKTGKGKGTLSHPERSIASWTKLPIGWILPHPTHIAAKDSRVAQKFELANEKYMRKTPKSEVVPDVPDVPAKSEPEDKCYDCKKTITFRRTIDNIDYCLGCAEKHEEPPKKKGFTIKKKSEQSPNPEPKESEQVEIVLEEFQIEGKNYFKDEHNQLYNSEQEWLNQMWDEELGTIVDLE